MPVRRVNTLVIGSGAAGLAAAAHLARRGVELLLCTDSLRTGTSYNTGSDKQTYYRPDFSAPGGDSPYDMARALTAGGGMHGDIALAEAALSPLAAGMLEYLGVPFPHSRGGLGAGYRTDHDTRRRGTGCGPYTSKEMCIALEREIRRLGVPVLEHRSAVKLLVCPDGGGRRCCGALFAVSPGASPGIEAVLARNVVFAVGGPGGLYEHSVYPAAQTGAVGLAVEAGARCRNLPEFQYGIASTKFRWNLSGNYMQVIPRFISVSASGGGEREFLLDAFPAAEMCDMIFLKGYQWPFFTGHLDGSSRIDLLVDAEIRRGRRVFLDFRTDPSGYDPAAFAPETADYFRVSGIFSGASPLERLLMLNPPAAELYLRHGIDLAREPLEIAVCAQHNNGGLAADIWWQSENLPGLFPVGEVNGTHGVSRPGGSALNAGQTGAWRAAEFIAAAGGDEIPSAAETAAEAAFAGLRGELALPSSCDWRSERRILRRRMSAYAAFRRSEAGLETALHENLDQSGRVSASGLGGLSAFDFAETLRTRQLLAAQRMYLESMLFAVRSGVGSRGGAAVLAAGGSFVPENPYFRGQALLSCLSGGRTECWWEPCRPVPEPESAGFEAVWKLCRTGKIYSQE